MWPVTVDAHWQFTQAEGWALSKSRCGAVPHSIGRGTGISLLEHIFSFPSSTPRGGAPRPQNQDAHWEPSVMMPDEWAWCGSPHRAHPNSWGMHPWRMLTPLPKFGKCILCSTSRAHMADCDQRIANFNITGQGISELCEVRRHLLPRILGQGQKVVRHLEGNNICFRGYQEGGNAIVSIATCVPIYIGAVSQPCCLVGLARTLLACQIY